MAAGRVVEHLDHNERHRRRVPNLHAHTTGGGETGGNGKVEQRGSHIGVRFGQRWPEEGDPAAAADAAHFGAWGCDSFFYFTR
jgi:hypothetical protein